MVKSEYSKEEIKNAKQEYKKSLANPVKHNQEKTSLVLYLIKKLRPWHNFKVIVTT